VSERLFDGRGARTPSARGEVAAALQPPRPCEPQLVGGCFELRYRGRGKRGALLGRCRGVGEHARELALDPGVQLGGAIAQCDRSLDGRLERRRRAYGVAGVDARGAERRQQQRQTGVGRREHCPGSLEEPDRPGDVAVAERRLGCASEQAACAHAQLRVVQSELDPELERTLEMEADDRVRVSRDAFRHGLVQIGAERLRHRVVDRVANECMGEAEALVSGGVGLEETSSNEIEQPALRSVALPGWHQAEQVLERKTAAEHRRTLEDVSFIRGETVDPRLQDGADRSRRRRMTSLLEGERRDLLDEQRVALGEPADRVPQGGGCAERVDQAARLRRREGLQHERSPGRPHPLRPELGQLRPADAHDEHPGVPEPCAKMLDQVEHRLLRPVHVVERHDDRLPERDLGEEPTRLREDLVAGDLE
jgi:hypothetical protein